MCIVRSSMLLLNNNFLFQIEFCFTQQVYIVQQISQALVYMHGFNPAIVHLDIKPENILV